MRQLLLRDAPAVRGWHAWRAIGTPESLGFYTGSPAPGQPGGIIYPSCYGTLEHVHRLDDNARHAVPGEVGELTTMEVGMAQLGLVHVCPRRE